MQSDEEFMLLAFDLARAAVEHGNQPFGALVVKEGEIIVQAESTKITTQDCSRHAELTVASRAAMFLSKEDLKESTLYTSTEPCAMCTGAIYWSGIGRLVYGCPNEDLSQFSGDNLGISSREILSRGTREVEVVGPILRDEAVEIHRSYWDKPKEWWRGD
jgi:tRNA(Arg) A34 adenosine deaminase TadA